MFEIKRIFSCNKVDNERIFRERLSKRSNDLAIKHVTSLLPE